MGRHPKISQNRRFADKRLSYTHSWKFRVQMAILEFNWPGQWQLILTKRLHLELPIDTKIILKKIYTQKAICRKNKREDAYLKKERIRRAIKKNKNKSNDNKSDDYIYHSSTKTITKPDLHDFNTNHNTDKLPVRGVWFTSPKKEKVDEETTQIKNETPPKRIAKLKSEIPKEMLLSHRMKQQESTQEFNDEIIEERCFLEATDDNEFIVSSDESDDDFYPYCKPDEEDDEIAEMLQIEEDD